MASTYLFEDITLYFTEASHAKMMAISQHPDYRMCVRTVGISPKAIFGPLLDRDEFGQWIRNERPLVMSAGYSHGYMQIPKHMFYLFNEGMAIDFHYSEYVSLYRKQQQLSGKAGSLLKTAISCFPRLREVWPSVRPPLTTYCPPCTDEAFVSEIWQASACLYKYDLDHSVMILTAVSQGRSLATTQLEMGQFFYKLDTLVMGLQDAVAGGKIQKLVAGSKKIELSILTLDFPRLQQALDAGKCKEFLGLMKNLESVSCWLYELLGFPIAYPSISDIFGNNTWQQLRHLEIRGLYTYAGGLAKLINRHRSTLHNLLLQDILLSRGSWQEVFVEVRGSAIQTVKVHHLGCGDDLGEFFDHKILRHLDLISTSHPLHAFLFRGALWRLYIDVLLEFADPDSDLESESGSDAGSESESDSDLGLDSENTDSEAIDSEEDNG